MALSAYPLKFQPIPQERIWGGKKLSDMFQLHTGEKKIGEVWTLSDHPNAPSICTNGELKGKTLADIIRDHPQHYLGQAWSEARFPLLIKFLHAEDDLSVQIHPDDEYAQKHEGDYGKTEAWYILDAEPGAKINYGHSFQNREAYFQAVRNKKVQEYLKYEPVKKDDFFFVPSRTLHALLRGTMVVEIQQTSDVTYRVYDWDRVNEKGESRELHVDKAADVMKYETEPVPAQRKTLVRTETLHHEQLVQCPYFTIEKIRLNDREGITLKQGKKDNPDVNVVVEGNGTFRYEDGKTHTLALSQGDTLLIPGNIRDYRLEGNLTVLRTFY